MTGRRRRAAQPDVDDPDLGHAWRYIIPRAVAALAPWTRASFASSAELARLARRAALVALVVDARRRRGLGRRRSARAVFAARLEHVATAPLYDVARGVAALVPGRRARVPPRASRRAARRLHTRRRRRRGPRARARGSARRARRRVAPRDRAAVARAARSRPPILAACGTAWALALTGEPPVRHSHRRLSSAARRGSAPRSRSSSRCARRASLLALRRRDWPLVVALWLGASGSLPGFRPASRRRSRRPPGRDLVGAGLLGIGFGALTALPTRALARARDRGRRGPRDRRRRHRARARRARDRDRDRARRDRPRRLAGTAAAPRDGRGRRVPLASPRCSRRVLRPGRRDAARLASISSDVPPGPGVFVTTRTATWLALALRGDHRRRAPRPRARAAAPPLQADVIVANTLRAGESLRRMPPRSVVSTSRAIPRRRGFQLVGDIPDDAMPVLPPATYATAIGREAIRPARARARAPRGHDRPTRSRGACGGSRRPLRRRRPRRARRHDPDAQRPALFGFLPLAPSRPDRGSSSCSVTISRGSRASRPRRRRADAAPPSREVARIFRARAPTIRRSPRWARQRSLRRRHGGGASSSRTGSGSD